MFQPRPKQQAVLAYTGGRMGVSAVPGSGKTHVLSALAARLIVAGRLDDDQEVLIVTLVNSAVDNFAARVAGFIRESGLLPNIGYRVRTLHGLAHDIVRERPALVGLSDGFQIVDEREADQIRQDVVRVWVKEHPDFLAAYLAPELLTNEGKLRRIREVEWPKLVSQIAGEFIRQAKDLRLAPADLRQRLAAAQTPPHDLLEMCCAIYEDYQRGLAYRGGVDFDDLVLLAYQALRADADYLARLRHRWPFILEDEAQDSSRLQEAILRLLSGPDGNWVRVGDPNQAIYETFTTASPYFLRRFLDEPGVQRRELPNSGRSTRSIIALANYLIEWTRTAHPVEPLRDALTPPHIEPTPPGDPQPNPPDAPDRVWLFRDKLSPQAEIRVIVDSLARWLPDHPEETVAVLVPRNERGFEVAAALKERGLPHFELLRSTISTREAAGALGNALNYLADPVSAKKLARLYLVWRRESRKDAQEWAQANAVAKALRRQRRIEDFLWPRVGRDWRDGLSLSEEEVAAARLADFRQLVRRWQEATLLPVDQLLLTLAQDLFTAPADLAVAHKLAAILRQMSTAHPDWRLPELTAELTVIARNERRFLGLGTDDSGFDPDQHRGEVVIATVHKAKGLEWDRVYLMAVNNYNFPSALPHDRFIAERWFVRDGLNLEAEALARLDALAAGDAGYEEGTATRQARLDYAAERLRLLYVGITRARRELIITWNSGRRGDLQPAVPLIALWTFWEQRSEGGG